MPSGSGRFIRLLGRFALLRESPIGMFGAFLVLFWVVAGDLAPVLPLRDPLAQSGPIFCKPAYAGAGRRHSLARHRRAGPGYPVAPDLGLAAGARSGRSSPPSSPMSSAC